MTLHARIPAAEMNGASALYRDFIAGGEAPIHRWLPPFREGIARTRRREHAPALSADLVDALVAYNESLGVDAALVSRLRGLRDGSSRLVVTGQQPGVMGGPLLTLYKAATAVALAREIEARSGQPCTPLFWLGADDDDFAEVRDFSVIAADHSRLDASLDASRYRPGLRVGDIPAAAVAAVWNAVAALLPDLNGSRGRIAAAIEGAGDLADVAARTLVTATGGHIAIVDGRAPELRRAGKDLLLRFFDRETQLREMLESGGRELEASGYHAQVQWGNDSGLFLVEDGIRRRIPTAQRDAARAEFERDISLASPGVVARNLLQDSVLAPLAVVLGPAEIAYRAQMAGLYREMNVAMPVVCPRVSATFLPPAVREMMEALGLDATEFARDPAVVAGAVMNRSADDGLKSAAATVEEEFAKASLAFLAKASARLDERDQKKLQKRFDELSSRLTQALAAAMEQDTRGPRARWPFLPRMADMFRKDAVTQERFLALVTPALFHGDDAWRCIDEMSSAWARDALDGRVSHIVYSG